MPVYDSIARSYDITRKADAYIAGRLSHYLHIKAGGSYLDVACGTGNYTAALCRPRTQFWGIDVSNQMLGSARRKASQIAWCRGNAEALPFQDESFSGAVCVLAIHYFWNLSTVFSEIARVISHGNLAIFTATPEQMAHYWLNHYFPEAMKRSMKEMPGQPEIIEALRDAGFRKILLEPYEIRDDLADFFLYSGKHHPEIYLEPEVRGGIGTFIRLAETDEIAEGCGRLKADIQSGQIKNIMSSYQSKGAGDYLFIIAEKS